VRIILAQLSEGALLQNERALFPHASLELQCARVAILAINARVDASGSHWHQRARVGLHKICTSINARALLTASSRRAQGARAAALGVLEASFQRAGGVRELFTHTRRTGRICLFQLHSTRAR